MYLDVWSPCALDVFDLLSKLVTEEHALAGPVVAEIIPWYFPASCIYRPSKHNRKDVINVPELKAGGIGTRGLFFFDVAHLGGLFARRFACHCPACYTGKRANLVADGYILCSSGEPELYAAPAAEGR